MTLHRSSVLTALICALVFSLLNLTDFFSLAEDRIYDLFLHFRPNRKRIESIIFLDVDDQAISHIGVFPWPRGVMADGLLRLKEYGAQSAIFDIEYIDKSPEGVDEVYRNQGLSADFNRAFSTLGANFSDFVNAVSSGQLRGNDLSFFSREIIQSIEDERDSLLKKTGALIRNNDEYLSQASQLFGRTWATVNIQSYELTEEQAERRILAEEKFSYSVNAAADAKRNTNVDILAPIPSFMKAARGAGFTNVTVDTDGVRRRILLAREIRDHWYLQLAFAPLVEYLGNPEIHLEKTRLSLKNALVPGEGIKDITIPLDASGAMLLDWPPTSYNKSFTHISFAIFSRLEEYESHIMEYLSALAAMDLNLFRDTVSQVTELIDLFDAASEQKTIALEENSESAFTVYVVLRDKVRNGLEKFLVSGIPEREIRWVRDFYEKNPDETIQWILEDADYVETLREYLNIEYQNLAKIDSELQKALPGKFCIIGRSDTGTTDIGVNPFDAQYVNVGTHGVVLDTILTGSFITPLGPFWSILISLLLTPILIILFTGFRPALRFGLEIAGALLIGIVLLLIFRFHGVFLGPLGPVLSVIIAAVIREIIEFMGSEQEKRFIRKAFSTYLSGDVVQEILSDPSRLHLGGTKRYMTAMFTDVMGFSTISEKMDPEDLVRILNQYLSAMSDIVLEQRGTIDKFEGDAIIAFFGAPLEIPDHALLACTSAIMMKQKEHELNKMFLELGISPTPLLTRIGINTGNMVVGNMGTERKMDYTIMGNEVNLAARLEGVNKQYGTWILASEATVMKTEGRILTRRLDRVRVVGINEPVQLYELIELVDDATDEQRETVILFHEALNVFEAKDWTAAEEAFRKVLNFAPKDNPSKVFFERCRQYRKTPPEKDWDGVINLNQK